MAWATAAEVLATTGETVTEAKVAQASAVITIYAERTEDMRDALKPRDLVWLREATCWQAAWQGPKAGFARRDNVDEISQDGMNIVHGRGGGQGLNEHKVTLAPLAARALKNLSWKGTRTLRFRPAALPNSGLADSERADELFPWRPM